jgi:hypothetical protein
MNASESSQGVWVLRGQLLAQCYHCTLGRIKSLHHVAVLLHVVLSDQIWLRGVVLPGMAIKISIWTELDISYSNVNEQGKAIGCTKSCAVSLHQAMAPVELSSGCRSRCRRTEPEISRTSLFRASSMRRHWPKAIAGNGRPVLGCYSQSSGSFLGSCRTDSDEHGEPEAQKKKGLSWLSLSTSAPLSTHDAIAKHVRIIRSVVIEFEGGDMPCSVACWDNDS